MKDTFFDLLKKVFVWQNNTNIYFFISLKLWPYYTTGQWGEYMKICLLNAFKYFYGIFVVFYHKICVFVIFTSFFDEVSKQTQ